MPRRAGVKCQETRTSGGRLRIMRRKWQDTPWLRTSFTLSAAAREGNVWATNHGSGMESGENPELSRSGIQIRIPNAANRSKEG